MYLRRRAIDFNRNHSSLSSFPLRQERPLRLERSETTQCELTFWSLVREATINLSIVRLNRIRYSSE